MRTGELATGSKSDFGRVTMDSFHSFPLQRYVNFLPTLNESSSLVTKLEKAVEEVEALRNTIGVHVKPELAQTRKEMGALLKQMQELSATIEVSLSCHTVRTCVFRLRHRHGDIPTPYR